MKEVVYVRGAEQSTQYLVEGGGTTPQSCSHLKLYIQCLKSSLESRHMIVCHAAQEAGVPHCEYINRKKENAIFTPM